HAGSQSARRLEELGGRAWGWAAGGVRGRVTGETGRRDVGGRERLVPAQWPADLGRRGLGRWRGIVGGRGAPGDGGSVAGDVTGPRRRRRSDSPGGGRGDAPDAGRN